MGFIFIGVPLMLLVMIAPVYGLYHLTINGFLTVQSIPHSIFGVFALLWIFAFPIITYEVYRMKNKTESKIPIYKQ